MIRKQVGDLSTHTTKYTSPALTQKVFANMRRVGKGFSGVETPLFEGMVVAQEVVEGVADEMHDEGVHVAVQPHSPQPQPQQDAGIPMNLLQEVMDTCTALTRRVEHLELDTVAQAMEIKKLKRRVKKLKRRNKERMTTDIDADADVVLEEAKDVADDAKDDHANKVLSMYKEESKPAELQEVVDIVTTTKIITKVVTVASTTINVVDVPIPAATTTAALKLTAAPSKKRKGVVIRDPEESTTSTTSTIIHSEAKSKDKVIDHVNKKEKKDKSVKRYQAMKRKPQTEAQARKNMIMYLKNVVGFKMDYIKGMSYDDIRAVFEKHFDLNVAFLQKTKDQIKEEESRALKRINETLAEKAAKSKKLDEEVEELKRHLQIVPNKNNDVYTEATPLARKVPTVDYEIDNQNNKPYFKIIRADGTHQLYKNQRSVYGQAKVKSLKLLESCGVQKISFTTTRLILLVERKYPLTKFTLNQMLNNVRLEVEEESGVSLELLRLFENNIKKEPS
nr:hypothetical protein [Tanacetum cinerariifolium]